MKNTRKTTATLLTILLPVLLVFAIHPTTSAFAASNSETVTAETNATTFHYGQTIQLTIEDFNHGTSKMSNKVESMKTTYAGIPTPCGVDYVDFAFLQGNHANVSSYDELVAAKNNTLNVVYPKPYKIYLCPMGYFDSVKNTDIDANSHDANVTFVASDGSSHWFNRHLKTIYNIQNLYGKETLQKQISPNEIQEYVDSKPLPVGTYTVFAFTLSGQISKPLLIEVTNSTVTATTHSPSSITTGVSINSIVPSAGVLSLLTIPVALGGVIMAASRKQLGGFSNNLKVIVVFIIVAMSIVPVMGSSQQAFATYNVSSQGVEHRNVSTSFKSATVEDQFQGLIVDANSGGVAKGLTVQNNHFINNFVVGTDYLWSQSAVLLERPNSVLTYNHSCTDQSGSAITCTFPSTVNVEGVYNIWTNQFFFSCPSGFVGFQGLCVDANSGTLTGVSVTSSTTRIDLNAFQAINSGGTVTETQKYRTCTGSFSCTSYSQLYTYTTSTAYANSSTGYYNSQSIGGTTYYGVQGPVGECGNCDDGHGRVNFGSGTYTTQTYTLTGGGTSASPAYRASGTTVWPSEENNNLCWWNTISNSGGSNPTFTTTAEYNTSCAS